MQRGAYPPLFPLGPIAVPIGIGQIQHYVEFRGGGASSMGIVAIPFLFLLAVILGPLTILLVFATILFTSLRAKRQRASNQEFQILQNDIRQIKADIQDIKEQIADFIIKTY